MTLLAQYFLASLNKDAGDNGKRLMPSSLDALDALDALDQYSWPGNVREFKNAVQRAYIMTGEDLDASHFSHLQTLSENGENEYGADVTVSAGLSLEEVERKLVLATLQRVGATSGSRHRRWV